MTTERLTGAFSELHVVDDVDGTPSETLIALTQGDVVINLNPETTEFTPHEDSRAEVIYLGDAPQLDFEGIVVTDLSALSTLGNLDGSNKLRGGFDLDDAVTTAPGALRAKIFEKEDDATAKQEILFREVLFLLNSTEYPGGDVGIWNAAARVSGDIEYEVGPP